MRLNNSLVPATREILINRGDGKVGISCPQLWF